MTLQLAGITLLFVKGGGSNPSPSASNTAKSFGSTPENGVSKSSVNISGFVVLGIVFSLIGVSPLPSQSIFQRLYKHCSMGTAKNVKDQKKRKRLKINSESPCWSFRPVESAPRFSCF